MSLKNNIYSNCLNLLSGKIKELNDSLHELTEGAEDAKSSVGDKHETERAMMQLEYEKIRNLLQETTHQKEILEKIDIDAPSKVIHAGSLVNTDKGYLFLSVAIGKINVDDHSIITLSPQSPLGHKLLGLKAGDTTEINGNTYKIKEVI